MRPGRRHEYQARPGGAFHPGAEAFSRLWQAAERQGWLPAPGELAETARRVRPSPWRLDASERTATHISDCPLTLNAIAKGYIIERASAAAARVEGVETVMLEIGGDLRVRGATTEWVAIVDPLRDSEYEVPATSVPVRDAGLATSGGYRRGVNVAGRRHSHVIDPRTGEAAGHVAGVTVIAPDAATADALATAFGVLGTAESVRLADELPGVACLLMQADGRTVRSARWPQPPVSLAAVAVEKPAQADVSPRGEALLELLVAFEINRPEGGRYQRPYVAIWVEDKDGFPVRTVLLWLLQSPKGERWIPDLRRWHRGDQMRRLGEEKDLVETVSGATRNPGRYSVIWDGKDDHGLPVKPGTYAVYVEAAREHGTYQLMKHEFEVGGKTFSATLKGNEEI